MIFIHKKGNLLNNLIFQYFIKVIHRFIHRLSTKNATIENYPQVVCDTSFLKSTAQMYMSVTTIFKLFNYLYIVL